MKSQEHQLLLSLRRSFRGKVPCRPWQGRTEASCLPRTPSSLPGHSMNKRIESQVTAQLKYSTTVSSSHTSMPAKGKAVQTSTSTHLKTKKTVKARTRRAITRYVRGPRSQRHTSRTTFFVRATGTRDSALTTPRTPNPISIEQVTRRFCAVSTRTQGARNGKQFKIQDRPTRCLEGAIVSYSSLAPVFAPGPTLVALAVESLTPPTSLLALGVADMPPVPQRTCAVNDAGTCSLSRTVVPDSRRKFRLTKLTKQLHSNQTLVTLAFKT